MSENLLGINFKKKDLFFSSASQTDQEDAFLLKIIEGYCSLSHGSRSKKLSASGRAMGDVYQPPQLLVAEDEKIFVEEMIGDEVVVHEKLEYFPF